MKLKLFAAGLALSLSAQTNIPIGLLWDAPDYPSITNYTVYGTTNFSAIASLATAQLKMSVGTNTAAAVVVSIRQPWYFVVTATAFGSESLPSNVVTNRTPSPLNNHQW